MNLRLLLCVWLMTLSSVTLARGDALDFSLHKHTTHPTAPTLLIIGGIQGDEPGGFNAASLLVTDYHIDHGNVWVVPNLNFESIVHRSRGVHGDMNRKFLDLSRDDPEYETVRKIKAIIRDKQVDVILNLHDGSGFYRPQAVDGLHNPNRWGQCVIIDQSKVPGAFYSNLTQTAERVIRRVNDKLLQPQHRYHLKNTRTRDGDREMEKTLTYFAVRHNKAAFGIEASKSLNTQTRALYHLHVIESFMREMGIEYRRTFRLEPRHVKQAIEKDLHLALFNKRLFLDVTNARPWLRYIPMQRSGPLQVESSNPLIAVVGSERHYKVRYGNRGVANLHPEFMEFDDSLEYIPVLVDNRHRRVRPGEEVQVKNRFMVLPEAGYRVNVIGFVHEGADNEAGIFISRDDIMDRYSVDKQAKKFRIEVYRGEKFSGMFLVDFAGQSFVEAGSELAFYPLKSN